jgi:hypothetical protein
MNVTYIVPTCFGVSSPSSVSTWCQAKDLKIIGAEQVKTFNNFKNADEKLLKTNAAICFNKICRINQLTPNYVPIKVKGDNQQGNCWKVYFMSAWFHFCVATK